MEEKTKRDAEKRENEHWRKNKSSIFSFSVFSRISLPLPERISVILPLNHQCIFRWLNFLLPSWSPCSCLHSFSLAMCFPFVSFSHRLSLSLSLFLWFNLFCTRNHRLQALKWNPRLNWMIKREGGRDWRGKMGWERTPRNYQWKWH